ncbi:hypothetical protein SBA2_60003 [Acidobacteriia bacterium SbA2]|nr:hypothetical protein SBA2_60003 [Acidobacteriia bacterium SbA2]
MRGSAGRNPSPGSLLSPPSPQGRGLKSNIVDGPLPWGEGAPQPAFSSARQLTGTGEGLLPENPNTHSVLKVIEAGNSD